jgi:hypothetical protein
MDEARPSMSQKDWELAERNYSLTDKAVLPVVRSVPSVELGNMRLYTEAEARRGKGR